MLYIQIALIPRRNNVILPATYAMARMCLPLPKSRLVRIPDAEGRQVATWLCMQPRGGNASQIRKETNPIKCHARHTNMRSRGKSE
jgi:hypothetical protein